MFGFALTPEWEEYLQSQGYDPAAFITGVSYEESVICEICKVDLGNDLHVVIEPPMGIIIRRKFHSSCFISHLIAHLDDPDDEISNYINRKTTSP